MTDDSILNGEIKRGNWITIYLNVTQIVYWESLLLDIQNDILKIRCQEQGETVITAESLFFQINSILSSGFSYHEQNIY